VLAEKNADKPPFYTYKLVDAGKSEVVERPDWW